MKHYSLLDIFASVRGTAYAFDLETGEFVRPQFRRDHYTARRKLRRARMAG